MESVWLRIKGHALCLNRRNLLIGACYAAPVSSKLYSPPGRRPGVSPPERVFGQLKALVQRYQSTDDELVILGDLNARVAKLRELPDAEADAELEIVAQAVVGSAVVREKTTRGTRRQHVSILSGGPNTPKRSSEMMRPLCGALESR